MQTQFNKKRNISIKNWEYNNFLFFKWFKINYQDGNICATEFLLKESYIKNFLENAQIKSNDDNIDLYPGHNEFSNIGDEKKNNPYLNV